MIHIFLLALAGISLLLYVLGGIEVTRGGWSLGHLDRIPPIPDSGAPRVSIVIPACNEEFAIEAALLSVLRQDFPDFEVIAVDDRSSDRTGPILDRMAVSEPRLHVIHVQTLPLDWLGKNHALQKGAEHATGDLLLFTDADVMMEKSTLRRAVNYMEANRLDLLAVAPQAHVGGWVSKCFLGIFALLFSLHTKPWKVKDPKSSKHIGIGAFNLVRTSAYRALGGHQAIRMRPDDDVKLGKLIKLQGYREDFLFGTRLLSVDWYHNFGQLQRGLMKNLFAGADYSITKIVLACLGQIALLIWPFVALFTTTGTVRTLNVVVAAVPCILFLVNSKLTGISGWWFVTLPFGAAVSVYLIIRATVLTLAHQGIDWRGTHYPLKALRANRI